MKRPLTLAVIATLVAGAAIAWMMTRRGGGSALSGLGDLKAPKLIELRALSAGGERKLDGKPELKTDEVLDFQIEVPDQCFVYVFRAQGGTVGLAWAHNAIDEAWNPGVYAPDWVDARGGMPFQQSGTVRLFAIASPTPQVDAQSWTLDVLDNVKSKCSRCGVSTVEVTVAAK